MHRFGLPILDLDVEDKEGEVVGGGGGALGVDGANKGIPSVAHWVHLT